MGLAGIEVLNKKFKIQTANRPRQKSNYSMEIKSYSRNRSFEKVYQSSR